MDMNGILHEISIVSGNSQTWWAIPNKRRLSWESHRTTRGSVHCHVSLGRGYVTSHLPGYDGTLVGDNNGEIDIVG